jgi:hypothetical protein
MSENAKLDPKEVTRALLESADAEARLDAMTDEELAAFIINEVTAPMSIFSPVSWVLENAVERLRRAKGGSL